MANKIDTEIAALRQLFPFRYEYDKYTSPQKKFKIILNELFDMGVDARIKSGRIHSNQYRYQVEVNLKIVAVYKRSQSAKLYLLRQYIKRKNEQSHEDKTAVA
jgi:hypothetical protein